MSKEDIESMETSPYDCDLIVAYLSYALDEVEAISPSGLHHLREAISSITRDSTRDAGASEKPKRGRKLTN